MDIEVLAGNPRLAVAIKARCPSARRCARIGLLDRGAGALAGDTKHLNYIDALRGYAILGVITVHASLAVPDLHWALRLGRAKQWGDAGVRSYPFS
jgi:hypothetical protein